jgi:plasmid stability protein
MANVATLYVRDVPERLYKRLKTRARENGRSLNAEVLEILDGVVERERSGGLITDKLRELAREINYPPDAPTPEQIIRELRDADDPRSL